jgi:hypothetical protein
MRFYASIATMVCIVRATAGAFPPSIEADSTGVTISVGTCPSFPEVAAVLKLHEKRTNRKKMTDKKWRFVWSPARTCSQLWTVRRDMRIVAIIFRQ